MKKDYFAGHQMSSPSKSQVNKDTGNSQTSASNIGNIIVGAAVAVGAAYGLWKALRAPAQKHEPGMRQTPVPSPETAPSPKPAPQSARAQVQLAQQLPPIPRPRPVPGESVEGWVTGVITARGLPRRVIRAAREEHEQGLPVEIQFGQTGVFVPYDSPKTTRHIPAEYGPPTAQFVFALVEYPSGSIFQWSETVRWADIDILWTSPEFPDRRTSVDEEPAETPELREMVERLVQTAMNDGWELVSHGKSWCNYRLWKRYEAVGAALKWK